MAATFAKHRKLLGLAACSIMLTGALSGCGRDDKPKTTQVAAKVDGEEISVHQINSILAKTPNLNQETAVKARAEVLEKLIDQQLMYAQAQSKKLDRTPEVVTAIENAKREIIARAHLEQLLSTLPKITDAEAQTYFDSNPALFEQRRIYNLEELSIEAKAEVLPKLKSMVDTVKNLDELATAMTSMGVQARKGAATRAAEQIGLDLLPKLSQVKDGDKALIVGAKNYLVVHVLESKQDPVTFEVAKPKIMQYLHTQRVQKAVADETRRLRDAAKVEYQGDFSKPVGEPPATPAAAPATEAAK